MEMVDRRSAILEFKAGEEDHPKISKLGRPDSTLRDSYKNAVDAILEIVKNTQEYHQKPDNEEKEDQLYSYHNNMIVFSAARGCGKSSSMLTFSRFLKNRKRPIDVDKDEFEEERQELEDKEFIVLRPIDPTILDEQHDVFSVVLSNLLNYASAKWEIDSTDGQYRSSTKRQKQKADIIQQFRKCQTAIYSLHKKQDMEDGWSLDSLSQLGSVSNLKKNFYELVQRILELVGCDIRKSHIIIQIDDADMNFSSVNDMLECIRSYMMVPNVIILLAADMELIAKIVYNKFLSDYRMAGSGAIHRRINCAPLECNSEAERRLVAQLTEQYILKFFPPKRQIHLPDIREFTQIEKGRLFYRRIFGKEKSTAVEIEKGLLDEIFVKTGLVFKTHTGYHYILPETQRGVGQLLAYLDKMKAVPHLEKLMYYSDSENRLECNLEKGQYFYYAFDQSGEDTFENSYAKRNPSDQRTWIRDADRYVEQLENWKHNVAMFRDYFMHEWVRANLSMENQEFMAMLHRARLSEKNGTVIKLLKMRSQSEDDSEAPTYSQVLYLLGKYQRNTTSEQLEFAVQVYYSIITQQIVLSRLIDYYAEDNRKQQLARKLADFGDLYNLYGSEYGAEWGQIIKIKFKSSDNSKEFCFPNEIRTTWELQNRSIKTEGSTDEQWNFFQSKCMSLFAKDYRMKKQPSEKRKMSLYAPIMNCLFMHGLDSNADDIPKYSIGNNDLSDTGMTALKGMQDMALRLVVNYDYRAIIRDIDEIEFDEIIADILAEKMKYEKNSNKREAQREYDEVKYTLSAFEFYDIVTKKVIPRSNNDELRMKNGITAWSKFKQNKSESPNLPGETQEVKVGSIWALMQEDEDLVDEEDRLEDVEK